jgi:hypothetical protein
MSTEIYDFDYEKALQKNSDNFVPLGSKKPKVNANTIRFSPIVVPTESKTSNIRTSPIVVPVAVKSAMRVSSKRAETPATTTARKAIVQKMPTIFKQKSYDYLLNRPSSPIQKNSTTTKLDNDDDDWSRIYDEDFHGGKKRTRKARSTRRKRTRSTRSTRSKRTKKSSSRRRRSRKGR